MSSRKSLPRSFHPDDIAETTLVEKQLFAPAQFAQRSNRPPVAPIRTERPPAPVIPFARPRAIAAMPATFQPVAPARPNAPQPPPASLMPPSPLLRSEAPSAPLSPIAVSDRTVQAPPVPSLVSHPPLHLVEPVPNLMPSRWAPFEKIGLVAEKLDPKALSKHVVTLYRLLGFAILTIIVIVLVGYITTTAFFYMSDSWIVPLALSPTDDKVMALETQLAERQNQRDQTAAALADAERGIGVQQAFQAEFAKAIQSDLDGRKAALDRMHQLAIAAASTRTSIRRSNSAFASASQARMAQEYQAGLIDRTAMLSGKFQLAQISSSNLSLVERQAEYEVKAADLEAQTRSLEALLANKATGEPMSYDVLKIKQEFNLSRLETQKAIGLRDTLKTAVARQDQLIATLKQASYLRAMADHAQVAYVPYSNLDKMSKGSTLYGCRLGMIICHKVGTVLEVLPGEVQFKHPQRDKQLRGQMVELQLVDGAAASDDVLFVGGKPLLL